MSKFVITKLNNYIIRVFAAVFLILFVWVVHILYLPQAAKFGMSGHDWEYLLYFDSFKGDDLANFLRIRNDLGNPYFTQIVYYLGSLKQIFGFNQTAFKLVDMLWKSIAALSAAFLVFKLTKDKLFAFFVVLFFTIFPSTAGSLKDTLAGSNFLIVPFACLFIYYYIQSAKNPKKILLASLFYYLALIAGPARAYLLLPVPFFIELYRLIRFFRPFIFLRRLLIFYFVPWVTLQSGSEFNPWSEVLRHIKLVTDGNLYTLTMPFQMFSALFIDQSILVDILQKGKTVLSFVHPDLAGFVIVNIALLVLSAVIGLAVKGKRKIYSFVTGIMIFTLIFEAIFYIFGLLSSDFTSQVHFLNVTGSIYLTESLNPTVFQASIGGYLFILGLALALEWWKNQRDNRILMISMAAWFWFVSTEIEMFLTSYKWEMIYESNEKYIFVCSWGAVIFTAGIFTLLFKSLRKIKNLKSRFLSILLLNLAILLIVWKDYRYLYKYFYDFNEKDGLSVYWQETMYQRFLDKFGKENLRKPIFLYIDIAASNFNAGSFYNRILYRIFYDENGNLIRDNCKVANNDINIVKKAYTVNNGEKGFIYDTTCIAAYAKVNKMIFYPLSNFYAYKMENKDFIDIKEEVIKDLNQARQ